MSNLNRPRADIDDDNIELYGSRGGSSPDQMGLNILEAVQLGTIIIILS